MMSSQQYNISIIIPTLAERDDLLACIESIQEQTLAPNEVIIINDGDMSLLMRNRIISDLSCPVEITSSDGPASSSTARNTGAQLAVSPIVLILDDDVVLGPTYLERLTALYDKNDTESLAGIGGFDPSLREQSRLEQFYNHLFYIGSNCWCVNKVGIQSWDPTVEDVTQSDWLSGNNASYKRDLLIEYPFPHWSGGREPFEDIAAGLQLKNNRYHCLIDPELPVRHYEQEDTESSIELGRKRGKNRIQLFKQYCPQQYTPLFLWALFGLILRQFLAPISDSQWRHHWYIGIGMILGIISLIRSSDE